MIKMKNKWTFVWLCLFLFSAFSLSAQQKEWTGQVLDQVTNEPLIGVSVLIKGTTVGTVTDLNGKFSIKASRTESLVFSYIGYTSVEIPVRENITRVLLIEDSKKLDEVVVVGYGVQQKVSSVGSIATIKGDDMLKVGNVNSVSEALQGMMPGVVAINTDSKPGADAATIYIRGKASWVSSTPLVLVDGVERDMNDVDANEIESISVLKDASATAVYGVKGANGVILLTTKRGTNSKPKIDLTANFGFKQTTTKPEYADYITTMNLWNEAATNDLKWSTLIPESTISAWENAYATGNYGKNNQYFPEIDWWDEITKTVGYQQQYNINITGGTDFMRYFSSIGYLNDGDIFKNQKTDSFNPTFSYQRYNWRTNFDLQLTKSTVLSLNLSGNQGYRSQPYYRIDGNAADDDSAYGQPQFFSSLYTAASHQFPIKYEDGSWGLQSAGGGNLTRAFTGGERIYKTYQNFIDVNLKQDLDFITKGLSLNAKFSFNASSDTRTDLQSGAANIGYNKIFDYSQPLADGTYPLISAARWPDNTSQGSASSASYNRLLNGGYDKRLYYEAQINYSRSFGNHNITAMGVFNRNEVDGLESGSITALKFTDKDEAWVTRATYNWKERYLLEFNGAYSGTQKFARGQRFAFFPSYSIGWRISEEPMVKAITGKALDNLKVRFSSGLVGYSQSASSFTYTQLYNNAGGSVGFGDTSKTTYGPIYTEGDAANPNATWETALKQNLGIDLMVFNKLSASIDLYQESRTGILMQVTTPSWFGNGSPYGNVGETKSHGIETELGWNDKINKNLSYWAKINYSVNENRVVFKNDAAGYSEYLKAAGKPIGYASNLNVVGYYQSLDDIFNYSIANNVPTQQTLVPGDFMYLDYNADGTIITDEDKTPSKYNSYPQVTYGGTFGIKYKSFQVSAMFYGVRNVYKNVASAMLWDFNEGGTSNFYANTNVTGRWTVSTASTAIKPALHSYNRSYSMASNTTYSVQDASYLRLKTLEMSYDINKTLLKKVGVQSIQIYLNGNNLFTFTKFNKQLDPEGNSTSLYPMVKRYNIGTRISF